MKLSLYLLLLLALGYGHILHSQNYSTFAGSRSAALAHSSVAISDIWASHHNQAALAFVNKTYSGLHFENRYFLPELMHGNLAFLYPSKYGNIGLSMQYLGFDLYNKTKVGINYSRKFGKYFSFGLQLNYEDYYVEEGSSHPSAVTVEIGIYAKPTKKLSMGFHLYNPTQKTGDIYIESSLPLSAQLGTRYEFQEDVALTTEIEKSRDVAENYKIGFEYRILEPLILRSGMGLQPFKNTFGVGLILKSLEIDFSYEYANILGSNAGISLQYSFQ